MKKFLKSPYTITILGGLIVLIIWSLISDYMSGDKLLTMFSAMLTSVYGVIISFLNFNIKVWWLLLGLTCIVVVSLMFASRKPQAETEPEFKKYTQDYFRTWKWSWNWTFSDYKGGWHISNLKAHCPKCDTPMQHDRFEDVFQCPRCRFQSQYDNHEKSCEVEAVIIDNLDRKKAKEVANR